MIGWIIGRARCFAGTHERSRRHARKIDAGENYTSKCMHCGVPMERIAKRNWVVAGKRPHED